MVGGGGVHGSGWACMVFDEIEIGTPATSKSRVSRRKVPVCKQ